VNEWISYECSDEAAGTCTPNIRNSSTRSHASEGENRTRIRSKNCKSKGLDTPDAVRQRDAIFRFSLTDNFDPIV
jgi:hypothetical protein